MPIMTSFASAAVRGLRAKATGAPTYRYFRLTSARINGASAQWNNREIKLKDAGTTNRASGITPTSNDGTTAGALSNLTDGSVAGGNKWIANTLSDGSGNLSPSVYVQFDLAAAYAIATLEIAPDDAASGSLRDFTLKASTTGSFSGEEVTLLTQSGLTAGWTTGTLRSFAIP